MWFNNSIQDYRNLSEVQKRSLKYATKRFKTIPKSFKNYWVQNVIKTCFEMAESELNKTTRATWASGSGRGQKWHARPGPRAQVAASHIKTTRATWLVAKAAALFAGSRFSENRPHFEVLVILVELKMEACVPMETKIGSKLCLWRLSAFGGSNDEEFLLSHVEDNKIGSWSFQW